MTEHRIGTQEEWKAARDELLKEEKALTRRGDELARKRRELPWVPVEKDYRFETEDGTKTLANLFAGRSQLLVYHFMFGPPYEAGCPVCTSIADTLAPQVPHLRARDTTLLLASRAAIAKLIAYRERMGWGIDWVSSGRSDFNRDLGFLYTEGELRPFLEGETPSTVEQNARMCGTDVVIVNDRPVAALVALELEDVLRRRVVRDRSFAPEDGERAVAHLCGLGPELDRAEVDILEPDGLRYGHAVIVRLRLTMRLQPEGCQNSVPSRSGPVILVK